MFCFNAEMVPSGTAIRMAITVASMAISSEIGRRVMISSDTGLPDHIEMPKSNVKNAPQEVEELHDQRTVESDLGVTQRDGARIEAAAAGAQAHHADVARDQPHQDEHERRRTDQASGSPAAPA